MASLVEAKQETLSSNLREKLSQTRYACSSLKQLSGGSTNYVYRGTLSSPLPPREGKTAPVETVIIKHSTGFLSVSRDFAIDMTRCVGPIIQYTAPLSPPVVVANFSH